jgi:hypothetical protein
LILPAFRFVGTIMSGAGRITQHNGPFHPREPEPLRFFAPMGEQAELWVSF